MNWPVSGDFRWLAEGDLLSMLGPFIVAKGSTAVLLKRNQAACR